MQEGESFGVARSYNKEMVMGGSTEDGDEDQMTGGKEENMGMNILDLENMKVEEYVEGRYACPTFIFSKHEDRRIHRP